MKNVHAIAVASLLLISAAAVACGGSTPAPPASPTTPETPSAPAAAPAGSATAAPSDATPASAASSAPAPAPAAAPWDSLNHEQRLAVMKTKVLPQMKDLFQAQDPKAFANFTCKTCHGDGMKDGKFTMPNEGLPKIPKDFSKWLHDKPEMVKFMDEKVVPAMAALVGEKPYDAQTKAGFGCKECHAQAK